MLLEDILIFIHRSQFMRYKCERVGFHVLSSVFKHSYFQPVQSLTSVEGRARSGNGEPKPHCLFLPLGPLRHGKGPPEHNVDSTPGALVADLGYFSREFRAGSCSTARRELGLQTGMNPSPEGLTGSPHGVL